MSHQHVLVRSERLIVLSGVFAILAEKVHNAWPLSTAVSDLAEDEQRVRIRQTEGIRRLQDEVVVKLEEQLVDDFIEHLVRLWEHDPSLAGSQDPSFASWLVRRGNYASVVGPDAVLEQDFVDALIMIMDFPEFVEKVNTSLRAGLADPKLTVTLRPDGPGRYGCPDLRRILFQRSS